MLLCVLQNCLIQLCLELQSHCLLWRKAKFIKHIPPRHMPWFVSGAFHASSPLPSVINISFLLKTRFVSYSRNSYECGGSRKMNELDKNTIGLAGEFAVLSQLALRGYDANMTLGPQKVLTFWFLIRRPRKCSNLR